MANNFSITQCMDRLMYNFYHGHCDLVEDAAQYKEFGKKTFQSALDTLWLLGLIHKTHNQTIPYMLTRNGVDRCDGRFKFYKENGNEYEAILRCRLRHVQAEPNEVTIE
jgi:hypothetical protein